MNTLTSNSPKAAKNRLPPSYLKVLGIILSSDVPLTNREIAQKAGWRSRGNNWVHHCMRRLREEGLIGYEDGLARTIRPSCTVEVIR